MSGLVPQWAVLAVLVAAVVAANLPFVNERLFLIGPARASKPMAWRLLELVSYATLIALMGRGLETHLGQASPLRWEFVVVWLCVFCTLAFPGFVWRHLRRS